MLVIWYMDTPETLIKPCVFKHPGGPSGLRRALRPAGGLGPPDGPI